MAEPWLNDGYLILKNIQENLDGVLLDVLHLKQKKLNIKHKIIIIQVLLSVLLYSEYVIIKLQKIKDPLK